MGLAKLAHRFSVEEYLRWESAQPNRNEYFFGEVFATVGSTDSHNIVAGNVYAVLRQHLRGSGCDVFMSDIKLRPGTAEAYFYPDVFVTCHEGDRANPNEKSHALLIIEVLSESTGGFDRGEKFAAYRRIEELREYVLIDPERRTIDLFRYDDSGHWVLWDARGLATIALESVDLSIDMGVVFDSLREVK